MDHDQLKIVIEAAVGLSPVRNKVRGPADGVFSSFGTVLNFNAIISRLDFRKTQHSSVDPVVIIRMENHHEKITLLRCIGAYRRAAKQQLCLHMMGFDSQAALYVFFYFESFSSACIKFELIYVQDFCVFCCIFMRISNVKLHF